jgi:fructuronate reductase
MEAMEASNDRTWGILGDVERTPNLVPALCEQGGWYTVLEVGPDAEGKPTETARIVDSVMDLAYPGTHTGKLLRAMANPKVRLITLTVTEKGYNRLPDGHIDPDQVEPDLAAFRQELLVKLANRKDADALVPPAATAVGLLMRGLLARFHEGGEPITILSCDNMAHNGKVLRGVVDEFVDAVDDDDPGIYHTDIARFKKWLETKTTWPSSMVDRITPAVTPEVLNQIEAVIGARDEAGVSAEPFRQWVIEDNFAADRPKWELVGAELTSDVAPWEEAKLRMLNGTHSVLAYAGRLFGHKTMAEAMADPVIAQHAREYMFDDAMPSVSPPEGANLEAYGEELLQRFANPATGHTTGQVSTDGTQKIPFRWGAAAKHHLDAGKVPGGIAFGLAAYSEFVRRAVRDGVSLGDPASETALTSIVKDAGIDSPATVAKAIVSMPSLLPDGVGENQEFLNRVVQYADDLAVTTESLV